MSRKSKGKRILAEVDPIYSSRLVSLLVIRVLKSGKKSVAQKNCLYRLRNYCE